MLTREEREQYAVRNANLRLLGFGCYDLYLRSALWKGIRQ